MIVSHQTFMYFCSLATVGLAGSWLVYDAIRLRRFWPEGERAHDEIFGSIIGIAVSLIGLAGVVRFHWGG
jgi:hypothetical protein